MSYGVADDQVEIERQRLGLLAQARDPRTRRVIETLGMAPGWKCWELGAGAGTVAAWMGERVTPGGSVWSTDIDTRFHGSVGDGVTVEQHDVVHDPVPSEYFDLVHARAVLQHIPERDAVLDRMVSSLRPGGWLLVEDGTMHSFAGQPLPEPYATVHRVMATGVNTAWRDPDYGMKALAALRARGLVDLDLVGETWAMRPGEPEGDWWFLAVERVLPQLVASGVFSDEQCEEVRAQLAEPGFVITSPQSIAAWGRRPPTD